MKRNDGWISEFRRKRFYDNQKIRREKNIYGGFYENHDSKIPKTISVMLDIEGTCDFIDDEKALVFIKQLDCLRRKFGAKSVIISISTFNTSTEEIEKVLDILSPHINPNVKIGTSFYYGGTYDYGTKKNRMGSYSRDKVKPFYDTYVMDPEFNNQWFAVIDDNISDDIYEKYQYLCPMFLCKPSQSSDNSYKNNFMMFSTTTKGFDGVLEGLAFYIDSLKYLSPERVLETQKSMMTHLSSNDLIQKVRNRDYLFLEKYFEEGFADECDYKDVLNFIINTRSIDNISNDELVHIKRILSLMTNYFNQIKDDNNIQKLLKLQGSL